jgi:hypothetical protein
MTPNREVKVSVPLTAVLTPAEEKHLPLRRRASGS